MLTLSFIRFDLRTHLLNRFPRHKLADDGTRFAPGQAVVTPGKIRAEIIAKFRQWEEIALVENADQFKSDLIVERNGTDPNRVDILMPPDLINQLRVTAAQVQFIT
jgi:phage tail sheath gpL-like